MCSLSSGDASDSICPKGWGIATRDGDGSYENLIISNYNGKSLMPFIQNYQEYDLKIRPDELIIQSQISFIRAGSYYYERGYTFLRNTDGYFWKRNPNTIKHAYYLYFLSTYLHPNNAYYKGNGHSLRCVARAIIEHNQDKC